MSSSIRPTRVATLPPRERILDAAEELFARDGVNAVTLQRVADRAATTKMAVYRHFESKDALVQEWLRIVAATYMADFDRLAEAHPGDPRAQILGLADAVVRRLASTSHRGCVFVNTIAELPDADHPTRRLVEAHKAAQARRLAALCAQAELADPADAAAEITFLLEGAQVAAQNHSIDRVGERLHRMVRAALDRPRPD